MEAAASAEAEKEKERKARKGAGKGKSGGGEIIPVTKVSDMVWRRPGGGSILHVCGLFSNQYFLPYF